MCGAGGLATVSGVSAPEMQRSSRDLGELRDRLRTWIARKIPAGTDHDVEIAGGATSTGYSSETVLLDVSWDEGGERRTEALVARLAPSTSDVPVFPSYDLRKQFETMRLVERLTDVPVPKMWWSENDTATLGSPFFVMGRVEGAVPPDMMPYTFGDNWLFDSGPENKRTLQESSVAVLAKLHSIERPAETFSFLSFDEPGASALERHVAHTRAWYQYAVEAGTRSDLVERSFGWLDEHWPSQPSETVLSWGDSRYRQHHVPRLPARRGARLGDGGARAERAGRDVDDLRPLRVPGPCGRARRTRDARLHASGRRCCGVRAPDRFTDPRPRFLRHLRGHSVGHRVSADGDATGALR